MRTRPRTSLGMWLFLGLASGAGCGRADATEDGRLGVRLARVVDRSAGGETVTRKAAEQAVGRAFASTGCFSLAEDGRLAAELWFADQAGPEGGRDLIVGLRIETPQSLRPALGDDGLEANVLLEREEGAGSLPDDLGLAVARAVAVLEARVGLARGDEARVAELLAAEDPELVLLALEWVRDRGRYGAPEALAALLQHPDERVALLAIEAVAAAGGPGQVPSLLRGVRLADAGHAHRTYEALASLGGPDAQAFLEFAVRNEDDPERRVAASHALARLLGGAVAGQESLPEGPERGHRQ